MMGLRQEGRLCGGLRMAPVLVRGATTPLLRKESQDNHHSMHRDVVVDSDAEDLERLEKSFRAEMEEMVQNLGDLDYLLGDQGEEEEEEEEDDDDNDDVGLMNNRQHLLSSKGSIHDCLNREVELPVIRGQTSSSRMSLVGSALQEEEHNDDTSIALTGDNDANQMVEEDSSSLQELRRSLQHAELKLSVRFLNADLERDHQEAQEENHVNDYGWDYSRERPSSSAAATSRSPHHIPEEETPSQPSATSVDDSWGDMRDAFRELERRMATKLEMRGVGVRHHWDQGPPPSTTTTPRRSVGDNLSGKAWGTSRGRSANHAY